MSVPAYVEEGRLTPSQCSGTALTQMQGSTRGENDGNMKRKIFFRICPQQMISNMITVLYEFRVFGGCRWEIKFYFLLYVFRYGNRMQIVFIPGRLTLFLIVDEPNQIWVVLLTCCPHSCVRQGQGRRAQLRFAWLSMKTDDCFRVIIYPPPKKKLYCCNRKKITFFKLFFVLTVRNVRWYFQTHVFKDSKHGFVNGRHGCCGGYW